VRHATKRSAAHGLGLFQRWCKSLPGLIRKDLGGLLFPASSYCVRQGCDSRPGIGRPCKSVCRSRRRCAPGKYPRSAPVQRISANACDAREKPCTWTPWKAKLLSSPARRLELARSQRETLAKTGARIVLVARDKSRADATLARLRSSAPGVAHSVHFADLTRLAEMKRVALRIADQEPRIDVVINNAGALFGWHWLTEDVRTQYMAYFVLTAGLHGRLLASRLARIISRASLVGDIGKPSPHIESGTGVGVAPPPDADAVPLDELLAPDDELPAEVVLPAVPQT
jgi:hypothetical protein